MKREREVRRGDMNECIKGISTRQITEGRSLYRKTRWFEVNGTKVTSNYRKARNTRATQLSLLGYVNLLAPELFFLNFSTPCI